jgi:hypothetical protein
LDPVVTGVELQLTGVMGAEHLEQIVRGDPQRIDLGVVDGAADLLMQRLEELTVEIDLDERHNGLLTGLT